MYRVRKRLHINNLLRGSPLNLAPSRVVIFFLSSKSSSLHCWHAQRAGFQQAGFQACCQGDVWENFSYMWRNKAAQQDLQGEAGNRTEGRLTAFPTTWSISGTFGCLSLMRHASKEVYRKVVRVGRSLLAFSLDLCWISNCCSSV